MSRWIYGYESRGFRSLTDRELRDLERAAKRANRVTRWTAISSILLGAISLMSIAALASEPRFAFPVFIGLVVAFLWLFSRVAPCESRTLLYRRAIRIQEVEIFERSEVPERVRFLVGRDHLGDDDETGVESDQPSESNSYWLKEEKFISQLLKHRGEVPQTIETVGRDGIVLLVQGKLVQRVILSPLVTVED